MPTFNVREKENAINVITTSHSHHICVLSADFDYQTFSPDTTDDA